MPQAGFFEAPTEYICAMPRVCLYRQIVGLTGPLNYHGRCWSHSCKINISSLHEVLRAWCNFRKDVFQMNTKLHLPPHKVCIKGRKGPAEVSVHRISLEVYLHIYECMGQLKWIFFSFWHRFDTTSGFNHELAHCVRTHCIYICFTPLPTPRRVYAARLRCSILTYINSLL